MSPAVTDVDDIEWRVSDTLVPYEDALAFMEDRAASIRAGSARECVWLLEHPPLFTAGTSADPAELFNPSGFPVFEAGRGGRYTYHGPGQRVGYVMLDLDRRGRDVRRLVHSLEGWVISTLAELGVSAHRADGRSESGSAKAPRKRKSPRSAFASSAGSPSMLCDQRVAGFVALRRHRSLRDQRVRRDQPSGAWERNAGDAR